MDLGEGIRKAVATLTGATIIDTKAIKEFNKELQKALLSADVEVKLVFELTKKIETAALSANLPAGVTARDYVINLLYEELVKLMGNDYSPEISPKRILLLGLYGSGKTTTAAKLAKFYQDRGMSAGVVCCDVTRPAAYEQLETLAKQAGIAFFGIKNGHDAVKIAKEGLAALKDRKVIVFDSSGRSGLDAELMKELKGIAEAVKPDEKALVISADIGQVAGKQASEFSKEVGINSVIVTKLDGSGKAGGALSAVSKSGAKLTFTGSGEKLNTLDSYSSKRFVARLLGMPDLEGLIDAVNKGMQEANVKPENMQNMELNFDTFYTQLKTMSGAGPLKNILGMMGMSNVPKEAIEQSEEKLKNYKVIISSMTKQERNNDSLLKQKGRIERIAKGSGRTEKDVKDLISEFAKMKKLMNSMKNNRDILKRFKSMGLGV